MKNLVRKLFATAAAIVGAGVIAYAANVPLTTGVLEPSQLLAIINALTQNINSNASGIINSQTSVFVSAATTAEQTLFSVSINANTLTQSGQKLRARCYGTTGTDTNFKSPKLYIGTNAVSAQSMQTPGQNWDLQLEVTYGGSATDTRMLGISTPGSAQVNFAAGGVVVATTNLVDDLRTTLLAKCTTTQTSSTPDTTGIGFSVEQIK